MEEKFYLDDFEISLQEHANQFKMVPTKKAWHGIYNDLHPGRRWPSFMMSLLLIFSIVFIGYINSHTDKNVADLNLKTTVTNNGKDFSKRDIANENNPLSTKPIVLKNDIYGREEKSNPDKKATPFAILNESISRVDRNILNNQTNQTNTVFTGKASGEIKTDRSLPLSAIEDIHSYSLNKKENTVAENKMDKENYKTDNNPDIISNQPDISLYAKGIKSSLVQNPYKSLPINVPELVDIISAINKRPALAKTEQTNSENNLIDKAVLKKTKKRNDKISWVYYAAPYVSSVSFSGVPLKENTNSNLSASPLPQVTQKEIKVIRNAAFGFEAGVQMNYSFAAKLQFTTGAQVTRSGYNIISNLVHPTLATLTLRNPSTGDAYSRNFVTHYGDGMGKSTVTLHNYSYQASIPLGVQYNIWDNNNMQVSIAANFEPSLIFKADAYILSSDGKNYVNVPDLMRKWNFSSNFAPFVSFRSSRFKWNIGPDIRYQWLSTYQKNYTVKEHLIDYGIRVGISK